MERRDLIGLTFSVSVELASMGLTSLLVVLPDDGCTHLPRHNRSRTAATTRDGGHLPGVQVGPANAVIRQNLPLL